MPQYTLPCGHVTIVSEEEWALNGEGDFEDCDVCERERALVRASRAAYHDPLDQFVAVLAALPTYDEFAPDSHNALWSQARDAVQRDAAAAIERGLSCYVFTLQDREDASYYQYHRGTINIWDLLENVRLAHYNTASSLWCGEHGVDPGEGTRMFWLLDMEIAHQRLDEEMIRRLQLSGGEVC